MEHEQQSKTVDRDQFLIIMKLKASKFKKHCMRILAVNIYFSCKATFHRFFRIIM